MDAPRCMVCNTRHWSTQPCPAFADVAAEQRRQQIANAAVRQTPIPDATKVPAIPATQSNETPATKPPNATKVAAATKVKMGRPLIGDHPMTATERSRRFRERKALQTPSSQ